MNKIVLLSGLVCVFLLFGCCCLLSGETPDETALKEGLKTKEGISVDSVKINQNVVDVTYNELSSKETSKVYATWAYIFGTALNNVPDTVKKSDVLVSITCKFEDGESMKVSAKGDKIVAFLNKQISTADFMASWKYEYLTKGPQME